MNTMKPLHKTLVVGLTVLGLAGAAVAQVPSPPPEGRHGHALSQEQRQAKWSEHRAKRQAKLHDALKLNASQEAAWTAFVASSAPQDRSARMDRKALRELPAPQRMEKQIALTKQRTAMMEARLTALKSFYAVLTPEQQKLFDENSMRRGHRGKRMHS